MSGYVFENWKQQIVDVYINDVLLSTLTIEDAKNHHYSLEAPTQMISPEGLVDIAFKYRTPVKPSIIGSSGDSRLYAVSLINLMLSQ